VPPRRLTHVEKQWLKVKRQADREQAKAEKEKARRLQKLTDARRRSLVKLWPQAPFSLRNCTDTTGYFVMSQDGQLTYDELMELSTLLGTTKINLETEVEYSYDTFGQADSAFVIITAENVDWTRLDNV
jgi:hypothetical protein